LFPFRKSSKFFAKNEPVFFLSFYFFEVVNSSIKSRNKNEREREGEEEERERERRGRVRECFLKKDLSA
jgi:hypothetical protein